MSYYNYTFPSFDDLVGKVLKSVQVDNDEIFFETEEGAKYRMWHEQECCESVYIEDICGDIQDIIGSPILVAEEVSSSGFAENSGHRNPEAEPSGWTPGEYSEAWAWTFYKIDTAKGGITIRWCGGSNGYYSIGVHLGKEKV